MAFLHRNKTWIGIYCRALATQALTTETFFWFSVQWSWETIPNRKFLEQNFMLHLDTNKRNCEWYVKWSTVQCIYKLSGKNLSPKRANSFENKTSFENKNSLVCLYLIIIVTFYNLVYFIGPPRISVFPVSCLKLKELPY